MFHGSVSKNTASSGRAVAVRTAYHAAGIRSNLGLKHVLWSSIFRLLRLLSYCAYFMYQVN